MALGRYIGKMTETSPKPFDPIELAQKLIQCPSVTPIEGGALDALQDWLTQLGFVCTRLPFSAPDTPDVDNLYARLGTTAPHFCFAGHTDVVPVGDAEGWSVDPFGAEIRDGILFGRGATDMKGSIACFISAVSRLRAKGPLPGSISLLITGDEEGPAINGTVKMLDWLAEQGQTIDDCLVGEPTNPTHLGEMVKIGRRGSVNGWLTVLGAQGHIAYPHLAKNPVPIMARMADRLSSFAFDEGTEHFQPTNLEFTTIDVGATTTNVIPAKASAHYNIRFNDTQTAEGLETQIRALLDDVTHELGGAYELSMVKSGDAFHTDPGVLTDLLARAIESTMGVTPELSTSGGTSDARFIKNYARVVEFGLVSQSMHKVDEHAKVEDIVKLTDIYEAVLRGYFEV